MTLRVRTRDVGRNSVVTAERDIHALRNQRSASPLLDRPERPEARVAYLVEHPIPAVEGHLEGDVGAILNARNSRRGGLNTDTEPSRAVTLEITNDKLIGTGGGVKIGKVRRIRRGGDQHAD